MSNCGPSLTPETPPEELQRISAEFEGASPEAILRWAGENFGKDLADRELVELSTGKIINELEKRELIPGAARIASASAV